MVQKEINRILDRNVFFVREATEKEKGVFSDRSEGGFFTFALESGQKFVACFSEEGRGLKKEKRLTFRPLNKMVDGLKEFSWIVPSILSFTEVQAEYKFEEGVPKDVKRNFMYVLAPGCSGDMLGQSWDNPKLLKKALEVQKAYFSIIKSQKRLNKVLIPEKSQNKR